MTLIPISADVAKTEFCQVVLTDDKLKAFKYAVRNHYWYQMYLDDLPIWGIVGEMENAGQDLYLWTHKKFEIGYNVDVGDRFQIVDVNLTSEHRVKLEEGARIPFTYEVVWTKSGVAFADRDGFNSHV